MTIYVDDGERVKIYSSVKIKVAKAVMTLLETDDELVWSRTHAGYGVAIVDKSESEKKSDLGSAIESAYKTGYEMGRSITMINSVRDKE